MARPTHSVCPLRVECLEERSLLSGNSYHIAIDLGRHGEVEITVNNHRIRIDFHESGKDKHDWDDKHDDKHEERPGRGHHDDDHQDNDHDNEPPDNKPSGEAPRPDPVPSRPNPGPAPPPPPPIEP